MEISVIHAGLSSLLSFLDTNVVHASAVGDAGSSSMLSFILTNMEIGELFSVQSVHVVKLNSLSGGCLVSGEFVLGVSHDDGVLWDFVEHTVPVVVGIIHAGGGSLLSLLDTDLSSGDANTTGNNTNLSGVDSNVVHFSAIVDAGHSSLNTFVFTNVKSRELFLV